MSSQAFVEFYTKYLDSAAGEAARKQLEGIKDSNSFCDRMVAVGASSGFQFTKEEVAEIMKASEAKAAKALAKAAGELSEDQLAGVVGGASLGTSVPTVQIGSLNLSADKFVLGGTSLGNIPNPAANMSTVMCPW